MAIAPQDNESEVDCVGLRSKPSMVDDQVAPPSSERQTPPLADAA